VVLRSFSPARAWRPAVVAPLGMVFKTGAAKPAECTNLAT
jgi:hypothetical protein